MYRFLGFVMVFVPPISVFVLELAQFARGIIIPAGLYAVLYPLGILALLLYSLSYKDSPINAQNYVEISQGARLAAVIVMLASAGVVFLPFLFGDLLLGPGLALASIGAIWIPSANAAVGYGRLLVNGNLKINAKELSGTRNGGIAALFLAWFLKKKSFLESRTLEGLSIIFLAMFYGIGWLYISQAGTFPYSILGASMLILIPVASRRVVLRTLNEDDVSTLAGVLGV